MPTALILTVVIFAVFLLLVILSLLKKGRIPVKYALVWLFSVLVMLLVSLIPNLMESLSRLLGFELLSNMVLCLFIAILIFVTIVLTVMIAGQKKKTTLIIQEISILKKELEEKK